MGFVRVEEFMIEAVKDAVVVEPRRESVGSAVKAAREGKHLTVDEVARATRIRREFLVAIEEDRLEALPGDVFARGFVKSYADYVGLDGKMIANRATERMHHESVLEPAGAIGKHGGGLARVFLLTLVLGAAAAVWYVQKQHLIH